MQEPIAELLSCREMELHLSKYISGDNLEIVQPVFLGMKKQSEHTVRWWEGAARRRYALLPLFRLVRYLLLQGGIAQKSKPVKKKKAAERTRAAAFSLCDFTSVDIGVCCY